MQETSWISNNNETSTSTQNIKYDDLLLSSTSPNTSHETLTSTVSEIKIKATGSNHFYKEEANNLQSDSNEHHDQSGYVITRYNDMALDKNITSILTLCITF